MLYLAELYCISSIYIYNIYLQSGCWMAQSQSNSNQKVLTIQICRKPTVGYRDVTRNRTAEISLSLSATDGRQDISYSKLCHLGTHKPFFPAYICVVHGYFYVTTFGWVTA
ncbi:hypothetical protein BDV27DRAFT_123848 [Aspergillus caelatus]|uniref:Uncharacterized protein n=1 Tax=Aspergillus caelatus TaxID=61420 RepID=A0A5N7ACK8_9EURO|nr:uncharacterized protein BDV27DRAFT_123848 [Aspergillus caelatus]KAE8367403.1 hypothetical protein BDV27DRAFT_123848 [Aspergillus caelatus]